MKRLRCLLTIGCVAAVGLFGCSPSPQSAGPHKRLLVVWGVTTGPDSQGFNSMVDAFERIHPNVHVEVLSMGAGGMNSQKLMTSIVGNVAPDVVNQDRFQISDWASRGAFQPLSGLIERDKAEPDDPTPDKFYPSAWAEASYGGKVYGIPTGADNRALYWNKSVFKKDAAKLRAAGLDPTRPPRTWSELLAYSKVITEFNKDGSLKVAGFIPNDGNSWLYMYSFQNRAPFLSPDGRTCTLASPYVQQALKFMQEGYAIEGGYAKALTFTQGFQGSQNDPFYLGRTAMKIDGNWILGTMARYGPQTDFGVAPPPIPDDRYNRTGRFANVKDRFITWVGGYCYAIPRGAKNVADAWSFIKFATSVNGWRLQDNGDRAWAAYNGRTYIPNVLASRVANEMQEKEFMPAIPKFRQGIEEHFSLMPVGRVRPPTMVSDVLWQEHVKAMENALYGVYSIKKSLEVAQANVQRELDAFYTQDEYPVVNLAVFDYIGTGLLIFVAGIALLFFKKQRLGKLDRNEAIWAYVFISPWVIGFLVFTFGPMLASFLFSFTEYNVLNPARFVGVQNYAQMFTSDWPNTSKAFYNVGYLAIFGVPLGLFTGLAIALLLNTGVKGMRYYRTIFYLPSIVPGVASVVLWNWILNPDKTKGLFNALWVASVQSWLHIPPPAWFSSADWAKPGIIIMGLWGAGSGMILWLAGLKGVPTTLYEAAQLDGASPTQMFWTVTLPMLSPVVFFNTVMGFIGALQLFDAVFILQNGNGPVGPGDSLLTPVYDLFNNGFAYFKMGYASSIAWVIFAVILVITFAQFRLAPIWVHYEVDK